MNDYPIVANAETIRLITFSAYNLAEARWLGDTRSRDHGIKLAIGFARYTPTYTFAVPVCCRVWEVGGFATRLNIIARIEPRPAN